MKLSVKAKNRLASLINHALVNRHMVDACGKSGDKYGKLLFLKGSCECEISLYNEFGIELPGLESSKIMLPLIEAELKSLDSPARVEP